MRMTRLLALVVVAAIAGRAVAGREPKLVEYRSEKGLFRVSVPAADEPKSECKPISYGPNAEQVFERVTDRWEANGIVLAVTVAAFPAAFGDLPAQVLLVGARDGLVGPPNMGGRLLRESQDSSTHAPSLNVRLAAGKVHVRARLVVVGRRLYQVTVTGSQSGVDGKLAEEFLSGFAVVD